MERGGKEDQRPFAGSRVPAAAGFDGICTYAIPTGPSSRIGWTARCGWGPAGSGSAPSWPQLVAAAQAVLTRSTARASEQRSCSRIELVHGLPSAASIAFSSASRDARSREWSAWRPAAGPPRGPAIARARRARTPHGVVRRGDPRTAPSVEASRNTRARQANNRNTLPVRPRNRGNRRCPACCTR
jgi:hypothetical protein